MHDFERKVAFLFDIDGVVLDTPHEQAWRDASVDWELIDEEFSFSLFYERNVAGKPGISGARSVLQYLCTTGSKPFYEKNRITHDKQKIQWAKKFRIIKQKHLDHQINSGRFRVFDDVIRIILQSKQAGLKVGAVSSSENARRVLEMVSMNEIRKVSDTSILNSITTQTLAGVFDSTALGAVSYWPGVQIAKAYHFAMAYGKLLCSINEAKIPRIVIFEDSANSVSEAKKLGFYCVGISRNQNSNEVVSTKSSLLAAGADLAFTDEELASVDYPELRSLLSKILDYSG